MQKNIKEYIREMIQLLNDEALFHQRDVPGDQDEFEDRDMIDASPMIRHDLYSSIGDMINVYDALGDDYSDSEIAIIVKEIKEATHKLKNKMR